MFFATISLTYTYTELPLKQNEEYVVAVLVQTILPPLCMHASMTCFSEFDSYHTQTLSHWVINV